MQKLHFAGPSTRPVRPLPKALKWKGAPKFWKKRGVSKKKKKKNGSWLNPKKKSTPSFWPKIFGLNKINCPKNNTFNLRQTKIYNQIRWKSSLRKLLTKQSQINTHKKSQIPKFYPCPLSLSLSLSLCNFCFSFFLFTSQRSLL